MRMPNLDNPIGPVRQPERPGPRADEDFARLFHELQPRLKAALRRKFPHALDEQIEDAIQEAFAKYYVRYWLALPEEDKRSAEFPENQFPPLYTIARHALIDSFRREAHRPDKTPFATGVPQFSTSVLEEHEREEELQECVRKIWHQLKPDQQDILNLRIHEDRSFGEIAELHGITELAARKRYWRILEALRQKLLERFPDEFARLRNRTPESSPESISDSSSPAAS